MDRNREGSTLGRKRDEWEPRSINKGVGSEAERNVAQRRRCRRYELHDARDTESLILCFITWFEHSTDREVLKMVKASEGDRKPKNANDVVIGLKIQTEVC
jgi:hypothetical protein